MPRAGSPYGPAYQRDRAPLLGRPCQLRLVCAGSPATEAEHDPPLRLHDRRHVHGSGCCRLIPACGPCQRRQAREIQNAVLGRRSIYRLPAGRRAPTPSRVW